MFTKNITINGDILNCQSEKNISISDIFTGIRNVILEDHFNVIFSSRIRLDYNPTWLKIIYYIQSSSSRITKKFGIRKKYRKKKNKRTLENTSIMLNHFKFF